MKNKKDSLIQALKDLIEHIEDEDTMLIEAATVFDNNVTYLGADKYGYQVSAATGHRGYTVTFKTYNPKHNNVKEMSTLL